MTVYFFPFQNEVEIDECDGGNDRTDNGDNNAEPMEDDNVCNEQSNNEADTDATETSEQHTNNRRRRQISSKRTNNSKRKTTTTTNLTKTTVSRKLILKTPNMTPSPGNKNSSTPIGARTRGKKTTKVKKSTPSSRTKAKLGKSKTKRGSAIKTAGRKLSSTSGTSSSSAAASAAGEVEQQQQPTDSGKKTKRGRRTRRCLIKTDQTSEGLLEDDSNSNFSPGVKGLLWKINTEAMYSRNCKK